MSSWTTSFCKAGELKEYPRLVLIQLPQSYEPCALPMRHAGKTVVALIILGRADHMPAVGFDPTSSPL